MTEIEMGERLARLETGQEWTKLILGLIAAVVIGGFAFLGVQINRLDSKIEGLGARIDAQGAATRQELAQTRQELVGIANAISNSITAARQVQPQIVVMPTPSPGAPQPNPNLPTPKP